MKTKAILDLMVKDHNRLMAYLKDVENNLGRDFVSLSKSFNTFQWNLEKHFFAEERAIFAASNPNESDIEYNYFSGLMDQQYNYFSDLMGQHKEILKKIKSLRKKLQKREPLGQHKEILKKIKSLRKKLQKREPFDLNELKKLLVKHKTFEEKSIYPVIDQEIDESEKRFIIDRIKDIRL